MKKIYIKNQRNLIKNSSIFLILIFTFTLFLGIGYAQISGIDLTVSGIATSTIAKDVIITNIEYVSGNLVNQNNQNIDDPYLTLMTSKIELGDDLTSSITYKITVKNNCDTFATYDKAVFSEELGYDNPDIEFDVNGINYGDVLQAKEEKEIFITFKYKDTLTNISNNQLNSIINFRFLSEKLSYHSDQLIFDGTNYIDTEVKLFSEENIYKDFEISFDIINVESGQAGLTTILNSMVEKSPYPGFVLRLQNGGNQFEFNSPRIANKSGINVGSTNKVVIKRVNDVYFIQINDGTAERLGTYSGTTFDETTVIGASIDADGNPWRYFKGMLSNVNITVTESESYMVRFDSNGGTGTMDEQIIRKNETKALNANTFEKEAKMFDGWNTKADGSGTSYSDSEEVTNLTSPRETITLYAKWIDSFHYYVRFNENGGTGTMSNQEHIYSSTQALSPNLFTKPGYVFCGWNTKADGSGTFYKDKQSVKNLTNIEIDFVDLYAIWEKEEYEYSGEYIFDGSNYIDTGIRLFSEETIDKDFDISFEIVQRISTGNQATMMSAMDESGSPWPGIVYRVQSSTQDNICANASNSVNLDRKYNNNINKVLLKRRNGILYVSFNDGEEEQLIDMTSLSKTFNVPLVFGCSLNSSGNPQRYFTGTLSNMNVKLYE